jgi:hypothetical protein
MRTLTIVLVLMGFFAAPAVAQNVYVVPASSSLAWDYDVTADYISEFGVYLSRSSGILPDGAPDFRVAWPGPPPIDPAALYWTIDATVQPGRWHAVVTAFGLDDPATESGPSNEVSFIILGPPGGLRVVREMEE